MIIKGFVKEHTSSEICIIWGHYKKEWITKSVRIGILEKIL